ncbi:MAG: DUF423 domain-containing protein [Rhodospirillaceae bacterium]
MSRFAVCMYAFGALLALISVSADAFAAHGLVTVAPAMEQAVVWFKEGANFQMNHALGLLIATVIGERVADHRSRAVLRAAAVLLGIGAVLFSGALYSISFAGPGFFAPWGGIAAMIGWCLFAAGALMAVLPGLKGTKGEDSDVR